MKFLKSLIIFICDKLEYLCNKIQKLTSRDIQIITIALLGIISLYPLFLVYREYGWSYALFWALFVGAYISCGILLLQIFKNPILVRIITPILTILTFCWACQFETTQTIWKFVTTGTYEKTPVFFLEQSENNLANCIKQGDLAGVKKALEEVDVNISGKFGVTPLYLALLYQQPVIFEYLLNKGANYNIKLLSKTSHDVRTYNLLIGDFLPAVVLDPDPAYLKALLDKGLDPNLPLDSERTIGTAIFFQRMGIQRYGIHSYPCKHFPDYQMRKKADLEKLQALIEHGMNINWDYNGVSISGLFFIGFRQLDLPNSVDPFSIYCTPYFIPVLLDNNALIDKYFLTAYLKTTPTAVRSKYDKSIQDDFARSDKALLDLDPELFSKFSSLIDKRNQALSNKEEIDTIDSEIQAYVDYLNAKIRERSAKSTK